MLETRATGEYRNQSRIQTDGLVVLGDTCAKVIEEITPYCIGTYGDDPELQSTREHFAMKDNTLSGVETR